MAEAAMAKVAMVEAATVGAAMAAAEVVAVVQVAAAVAVVEACRTAHPEDRTAVDVSVARAAGATVAKAVGRQAAEEMAVEATVLEGAPKGGGTVATREVARLAGVGRVEDALEGAEVPGAGTLGTPEGSPAEAGVMVAAPVETAMVVADRAREGRGWAVQTVAEAGEAEEATEPWS